MPVAIAVPRPSHQRPPSVRQELPRDASVLLVASTGGHLAQLVLVAQMLQARPDSHWATFDTAQSRSLLGDHAVTYFPYIAPRAFVRAAAALAPFFRLIGDKRPDAVLSTGAAIAAPALIAAVLRGVPAYYLESVSRFDGPSLTGRAMARVPRVRCFTQHARWADARWQHDISVVAALQKSGKGLSTQQRGDCLKVFVTLGTISPYRFDSLVDRVKDSLPRGTQVTWQLGCTSRDDLPGVATDLLPSEEFDRLATEADLVITHAGIGTALRLLDLGIRPVVVPRRAHRAEHVDDHQVQAARELGSANLVDVYEADALSAEALGLRSGPHMVA